MAAIKSASSSDRYIAIMDILERTFRDVSIAVDGKPAMTKSAVYLLVSVGALAACFAFFAFAFATLLLFLYSMMFLIKFVAWLHHQLQAEILWLLPLAFGILILAPISTSRSARYHMPGIHKLSCSWIGQTVFAAAIATISAYGLLVGVPFLLQNL